jgi:hypothetical protein
VNASYNGTEIHSGKIDGIKVFVQMLLHFSSAKIGFGKLKNRY